jgi:hypothetical protein
MILNRDPESLPEDVFIHRFIEDILVDSKDLSSGVNGCIPASAFKRASAILVAHGGKEPTIVQEIRDPEVELTYIIK